MDDNLALQLRDNAKQQLQQIKTVESGIEYLNKVKAIEVWARAEKKDAELQNMVAEQKIRTQRILGQLIKDGQDKGEIATKGESKYNSLISDGNKRTLSEIGISSKESSTFQSIASIPNEIFEKEIAIKKQAVDKAVSELTTTGMMRVAKEIDTKIRNENISKNNPELTKDKKYRVIYADPPWRYNDRCVTGGVQGGGVEINHYPTMSIEELCQIPISEISEQNAVLFIWVTSPLLEDVFKIINAWGFKYKTSFIWDKVSHNMGHYNSVRHELLLICTKGSCTPDNLKLFDSVQSIEKTEHSKKPEEFRTIIETLYTYGNKIELFSRIKSDGWDNYGNQIQ